MNRTVHIIGAGLAGLATAVRLCAQGVRAIVYEATNQAGGRCRSYHDPVLGMTIDNGNHLLLSGNRAALGYLDTIGASNRLFGPSTRKLSLCRSRQQRALDPARQRRPHPVVDLRPQSPRAGNARARLFADAAPAAR